MSRSKVWRLSYLSKTTIFTIAESLRCRISLMLWSQTMRSASTITNYWIKSMNWPKRTQDWRHSVRTTKSSYSIRPPQLKNWWDKMLKDKHLLKNMVRIQAPNKKLILKNVIRLQSRRLKNTSDKSKNCSKRSYS